MILVVVLVHSHDNTYVLFIDITCMLLFHNKKSWQAITGCLQVFQSQLHSQSQSRHMPLLIVEKLNWQDEDRDGSWDQAYMSIARLIPLSLHPGKRFIIP